MKYALSLGVDTLVPPGNFPSFRFAVEHIDECLANPFSESDREYLNARLETVRGKNKPTFTPNVDCGDYVIIVNASKIRLTGKKLDQKTYRYHTGYVGGLKEITYRKLMTNKSEFAFKEAVRRMLPKGPLGYSMLKKLHVYAGPEHEQQAQKPEVLVIK